MRTEKPQNTLVTQSLQMAYAMAKAETELTFAAIYLEKKNWNPEDALRHINVAKIALEEAMPK